MTRGATRPPAPVGERRGNRASSMGMRAPLRLRKVRGTVRLSQEGEKRGVLKHGIGIAIVRGAMVERVKNRGR